MQFRDAIKAIKDRLSLVDIAGRYVDLRPNGSRFVAPCPFHQETKPSFYISPDRGNFYCFGCQASGDLIEFYGRVNGLDFKESVIALANEAGITIDSWGSGAERAKYREELSEKQAMLAMHEAAAGWFQSCLGRPKGAECRAYIERRGVSKDIQERFGLGWAEREWRSLKDFLARQGFNARIACDCGLLGKSASGSIYDRFRGRMMFPIKNLSNQIIAFGGRIIADEDEAKYINSADTPIYGKKEHLYGLAQARRGICAKGEALLTEGYMDVLTLHQYGFDNSVGVLGTALTDEQIKRLSGFTSRIGLLFDGDGPGRKAALRSAAMLLCRGLACSVILLPEGEDIDSLLHGSGAKAFEELKSRAPDGLEFCVQTARGFAPRETVAWAKEFVANIQAPELASHYITLLSQRLGIDESAFRERAARPVRQVSARQPVAKDLCDRDTQIMVFLVRYPDRIASLREIGADMALATERAREFWALIERYGEENVIYHLDEKQRRFWQSQRGPLAAPRANCERELECLKESLERFYSRSQAASIQAALSNSANGSDFASDLAFLHALRDTMRKDNEQS